MGGREWRRRVSGGRHRRPPTISERRRGRIGLAVVLVVVAGGGAVAVVRGIHGPSATAAGGRGGPADGPSASVAASMSGGPVPPTESVPPPPTTVTIAAVGDTMLGDTPVLPSSPSTYFAAVRRALRASIVFGNLEGTLTSAVASKCAPHATDCYAFRAPPSYAGYLRAAGFTILNDANNHSHDFGMAGLADTLAALRAAGIAQTGLPGQVRVVRGHGLRVAFVGFAPYPNTADMLELAQARALIERARRLARIVVVYMHSGAEGVGAQHVTGHEEFFLGEDRGNPEAFAHMAVRAGASLVIASGPHVLRGMEFYRGHLIAYSLGDFAGYEDFATAGVLGIGCVLRVTLAADGRFVAARIVGVRLSAVGQPFPDPSNQAARLISALSREDFGPRAARVSASGIVLAPVA